MATTYTRIRELVRTIGRGRLYIAGKFVGNGSSAISTTGMAKDGYTVTRTGTGVYQIALFAPAKLKSFNIGAIATDTGIMVAKKTADTVATDGKLSITCILGGDPTDVPAGLEVPFQLFLSTGS